MAEYTRLTDVLTSYWDGMEKFYGLPRESDIDTKYLEHIWDDCFLVEVTDKEPFKYDYLGKNIIEAYGEDNSRDEVELLVYPSRDTVAKKFREAIDRREVVHDSGEFINYNHMLIKYRQLLLPLSDGDGNLTHILGGMRWRSF